MTKKKILLVDDSKTAIKFLQALLESHGYEVCPFSDPNEALQVLDTMDFDVVLVDIVMPGMNGFDFIKAMKKKRNFPTIVVSSLYTQKDRLKATKAFEVGALGILEKPLGQDKRAKDLSKDLLKMVAEASQKTSSNHVFVNNPNAGKSTDDKEKYELVVLAASLGGPKAISKVLRLLPKNFPIPIVIIQHLGDGFDEAYAAFLTQSSGLSVNLVQSDQSPMPGSIYLAPGSCFLKMTSNKTFKLCKGDTSELGINVFLESLANVYGKKCIVALLTGMGSDGVKGLKALYNKGAYTIAQHQDGCDLYGMPKAAIEEGVVKAVVRLSDMANELTRLVT